jgi:hypothetical protein
MEQEKVLLAEFRRAAKITSYDTQARTASTDGSSSSGAGGVVSSSSCGAAAAAATDCTAGQEKDEGQDTSGTTDRVLPQLLAPA